MTLRNLLSRPLARHMLDQACRRSAITHRLAHTGQPIVRSPSSSHPARRVLPSPFEHVKNIEPRTPQPSWPHSVARDPAKKSVAPPQLPGAFTVVSLRGKSSLAMDHFDHLKTNSRAYTVAAPYDRLDAAEALQLPGVDSLRGKNVLVGGRFGHVKMRGKKMNQTMVKELLQSLGANPVTEREADKGVHVDFAIVGNHHGEKIMSYRSPVTDAVRLTELLKRFGLTDLVKGDEAPLQQFDPFQYRCAKWNKAMVRRRPAFSHPR